MASQGKNQVQGILFPCRRGAGRYRLAPVRVDGKGERLRVGVVIGRPIEERVVTVLDIIAIAGDLPVVAGKHARGRIHVSFGVVTDAEAEQLHDLAAKVFLGPGPGVQLAVQPVHHGRVFRHGHQHAWKTARCELAQHLDLSGRAARETVRIVIHQPRRALLADSTSKLRVRGGEVVVPEQRHLLFQRTLRVDHPEQPALTRVVDQGVGRKRIAGRSRDADVGRVADLRVVIRGCRLVVKQAVDHGIDRDARPGGQVGRTRAEPHSPKDVFKHRIPTLSRSEQSPPLLL